MHPALEAAEPGSASQARRDHQDHRDQLDALAGDLRALRSAAAHDRERLALQLYRSMARFVADNLEHMAHEATAHNAVLWSRYADADLKALEDRIVADTEPATMQLVLASMLPALNAAERAALLGGMRAAMPPAAFAPMLDLARRALPLRAWASLSRTLGLPPQPGSAEA